MTGKKKTPEDFLPECMKQELILLSKILDITKQIEVQSRQKDMHLDGLSQSRQVYIDRLKKCRELIETACRQLPEDQRERRKKIISGRFLKEECTPEEGKLLDLGKKSSAVLRETLALDEEARDRLQRECDRLQKMVHASHKPAAQYSKQ